MGPRYLGKYNDVLLFLVLIPLINTINYHLTYSRIRWDWYTYTTYLIDTVQGYIAWWLIRKVILWLDGWLPFTTAPARRIAFQLFLTNVVAQGFIILATEAINALYTDQPLPRNFYTYNLFIFFIWILVINGIYAGMYFYHLWQSTQQLREKERQIRTRGLEVQLGKTTKTLAFDKIAILYAESGSTYLRDWDGNRYLLDSSLNKLMGTLPPEQFFRLNRAYLAPRESIEGFSRMTNGKLAVRFKTKVPVSGEVVVSRITAPEFKQWFRAARFS